MMAVLIDFRGGFQMARLRVVGILVLAGVFLAGCATSSGSGKGKKSRKRDRVTRDFLHMDVDGDNRISRAEWNRRGNFDRLDGDEDGVLSHSEVRRHYRRSLPKHRPDEMPEAPGAISVDIDSAALAARVSGSAIGGGTRCGIMRGAGCDSFAAERLGMLPTGLGPRFPAGVDCYGIDDYWAMDYSYKRNRRTRHGGVDMPVDWGEAMLAVADGTVVGVFAGRDSKRGKEVVLRHAPDQTGLPFWTYTGYGHLDSLPSFELGQRVKRGDVLGPTGNSGIAGMGRQESTRRRAAIHFSVMYSESPSYAISGGIVVPVGGRWMDPVGFYRLAGPYETGALMALPDGEKFVDIPVVVSGDVIPGGSLRVWPYACVRD